MTDRSTPASSPVPTSAPDIRAIVAEAVQRLGCSEVSRRLGTTPESTARIAGGLDIRNGTRALVLANIHKLKAAEAR